VARLRKHPVRVRSRASRPARPPTTAPFNAPETVGPSLAGRPSEAVFRSASVSKRLGAVARHDRPRAGFERSAPISRAFLQGGARGRPSRLAPLFVCPWHHLARIRPGCQPWRGLRLAPAAGRRSTRFSCEPCEPAVVAPLSVALRCRSRHLMPLSTPLLKGISHPESAPNAAPHSEGRPCLSESGPPEKSGPIPYTRKTVCARALGTAPTKVPEDPPSCDDIARRVASCAVAPGVMTAPTQRAEVAVVVGPAVPTLDDVVDLEVLRRATPRAPRLRLEHRLADARPPRSVAFGERRAPRPLVLASARRAATTRRRARESPAVQAGTDARHGVTRPAPAPALARPGRRPARRAASDSRRSGRRPARWGRATRESLGQRAHPAPAVATLRTALGFPSCASRPWSYSSRREDECKELGTISDHVEQQLQSRRIGWQASRHASPRSHAAAARPALRRNLRLLNADRSLGACPRSCRPCAGDTESSSRGAGSVRSDPGRCGS
jgi:hypothetical protein